MKKLTILGYVFGGLALIANMAQGVIEKKERSEELKVEVQEAVKAELAKRKEG